MKDCKNIKNKLSAFLDNELPWYEELRLKHHLERCAECMRELDEIRGVLNLMDKIDDIEPSPCFWNILYIRLISRRNSPFITSKKVVQLFRNVLEDLFDVPSKPATIHTFSLDVFNDFPPESFGQLIYPISLDEVK